LIIDSGLGKYSKIFGQYSFESPSPPAILEAAKGLVAEHDYITIFSNVLDDLNRLPKSRPLYNRISMGKALQRSKISRSDFLASCSGQQWSLSTADQSAFAGKTRDIPPLAHYSNNGNPT
jgi:hypothetical protein